MRAPWVCSAAAPSELTLRVTGVSLSARLFRRSDRWWGATGLVLVGLLLGSAAPANAENPHVNTQTFRPSPHAYDVFATLTSELPEAWAWSAGLWLSYGKNPLVFVDMGVSEERFEVISDQLTAHAFGALAVTRWLSVGLEVPVHLVNDGDDAGFVPLEPIAGTALGDVRLSAKIGIVTRARGEDGVGLALELPLGLPTGDKSAFVSDGWSFAPTAAVDFAVGPARLAVNLGARLRNTEALALGTEVGPELLFRVGADVEVVSDLLTLLGEVQGASHDFANANNTYVEALVGGRLEVGGGFAVTLAGGRGFTEGYGSTAAKVVAQIGWTAPRAPGDRDGDGIDDDADRCPDVAEDMDGFEDGDGCPDEDNDRDGVVDDADRCPVVAEDRDGFEDEDGCPDDDNDGDGVADARDGPDGSCRDDAEDKDGYQDEDGCPDGDNDGDGILDVDDDCPLDAANKCGVKVDPCEIKISETVYFEYDSAVIEPESHAILAAVAALMKSREAIKKVEVQGHTDGDGDAAYNMTLSERRAEAVRAYLLGQGVEDARVVARGYGESQPIAGNGTPGGRARNRRVQFMIVEPAQSGCGR